jgi:antitoxin PrlF
VSKDDISYSTVSSKGQVTVPKSIRERLGVGPGDRVVFAARGDIVVVEASGRGVSSWYGAGRGGSAADWAAVRAALAAVRLPSRRCMLRTLARSRPRWP